MRDLDFLNATLNLLAKRHAYHPVLWSYAIHHNRLDRIQEYLRMNDGFLRRFGDHIDCTLATVDPVEGSSVSLRVTRCFINEVIRDLGLVSLADVICGTDFRFWDGYHPKVRFSRTKTLLAGDDICNHTLTWIE